ncbi:helicase-related protein [Conexibacter sp. CPCC 206217]|uniref:helicase-related protein n=1 Tax=Conexibacter sp. CPCC 206217 TaxID=3064574 RepID=UPI0027231D9F|nr:helicase-related protein [Conexibacter sp. CPCC 206217]MDO8208971.1 helicase-related protein [Conexibacter sp. CPCC 206217]
MEALIARQAAADSSAGLDWTVLLEPTVRLDERLEQAHRDAPVDLDDPLMYMSEWDRRQAFRRRTGLPADVVDAVSAVALDRPEQFDPGDPHSWRMGSARWGEAVRERLGEVERAARPVGVLVRPARRHAGLWVLEPTLSGDLIRLVLRLGGTVSRDLATASVPDATQTLMPLLNTNVLLAEHGGFGDEHDAARRAANLSQELGVTMLPGTLDDPCDRWGRLSVRHAAAAGREHLKLDVVTRQTRGFPVSHLGRRGWSRREIESTPGRPMELGEAVDTAVRRGIPVLLSEQAAVHLTGRVRVGRAVGRPGILTVTRADGISASSRRYVVEQAVGVLRQLKRDGEPVTLDAGARQTVAMTVAKPLADDKILLGRQRDATARMVVGSGLNASHTGVGKTIMSGRAIFHRAATTQRFRGMLVAEARLLPQWAEELTAGAPARGLPPLAPNTTVVILDDATSIAAQIRRLDREHGDEPLLMLVSKTMLERFPGELQVIALHLLIVDEALKYVNPATQAHRSLRLLRFGAVIDCWLLTATPRSRRAEEVDILVGLAVGDEVMIDDRPGVREGGDLMREKNAHRVRIGHGPHLLRVTRKDMAQWMPDVRPARAMPIEPDDALKQLLTAIREGGRKAYEHLLELLDRASGLPSGSAAHKAALVEISRAQGVVLGHVGVFLDASVDPETLTHSKSSLAIALVRDGAVAPAIRGGGDGLPLLRGVVAEALAHSAGDVQSLVFAERVHCLRQLAGTLRDRYGVDARVGDGSVHPDEFRAMKNAFVAGEFPIFLLSSIGQEGHNLQAASLLCNLDLPYTPPPLEQRVGRAARAGSPHDYIDVINPYIRGGAIEHIVGLLAPRGAESHQLLDGFEGLAAAESSVASQLGEITAQVAESRRADGFETSAAKLRVAASVFGAV